MSDDPRNPAEDAGPGGTAGEPSELPRIDFSTFLLSLAASAMVQLGLAPGLEGEKREAPDLAMARHTIDTIEMLVEKTRGNLDSDEERLLQSVLYEVRMTFVGAERGK
ncbi:MAG TPA: DUF1844 domain-containing protein [Myxococcota bacterium]|nr:DUF1844 domain-containing protein [Myxococcota bacterium]